LRRIGRETNWVGISAAAGHNLAVKSDGTLWSWGESVQGPSGRPTPIKAPPSPLQVTIGNKRPRAASIQLREKRWHVVAWGHIGRIMESRRPMAVPYRYKSARPQTGIKVWPAILETVAMQSDGSLWYWGENPNPAFAQGASQIFVPTRISPDTNWVDVGFGVNTVFAIKSDGTLWAWGGTPSFYGAGDTARMPRPPRRNNSDWRFVSDCTGWWCQGLIKKDGFALGHGCI